MSNREWADKAHKKLEKICEKYTGRQVSTICMFIADVEGVQT